MRVWSGAVGRLAQMQTDAGRAHLAHTGRAAPPADAASKEATTVHPIFSEVLKIPNLPKIDTISQAALEPGRP